MPKWKKTFNATNGRVYIIEYSLEESLFTMSGLIYSKPRLTDRNLESCGQCIDTIAAEMPKNPLIQRMHKVWERWHLNEELPSHIVEEILSWNN